MFLYGGWKVCLNAHTLAHTHTHTPTHAHFNTFDVEAHLFIILNTFHCCIHGKAAPVKNTQNYLAGFSCDHQCMTWNSWCWIPVCVKKEDLEGLFDLEKTLKVLLLLLYQIMLSWWTEDSWLHKCCIRVFVCLSVIAVLQCSRTGRLRYLSQSGWGISHIQTPPHTYSNSHTEIVNFWVKYTFFLYARIFLMPSQPWWFGIRVNKKESTHTYTHTTNQK